MLSTLVTKISTAANFDPAQFPPCPPNASADNQNTITSAITDTAVEMEEHDDTSPIELFADERALLIECGEHDDRFSLQINP